jgi:UDP:flavonoid glycosyltransferase YjiC (YdhE family)
VQPFIALAYGLKQAGHPVRLVLNSEFEGLTAQYGLECNLLPASVQTMLETEAGQAMLKTGSLVRSLLYFLRETHRNAREVVEESWRGCQGADLLVYSVIDLWGCDIAEKLGIPGLPVFLIPSLPTGEFPAPQGILPDWKGPFNRFTHRALLALVWQVMYRPLITLFRRQSLGLKGLPHMHALLHAPQLHAYSPSVISRPSDWPDCVQVTGYWFLPAPVDWQPPPELSRFLAEGEPPVYVGFGSMANRDAAGMTLLALEAGHLAGMRLVMARGWGGLAAQRDTIAGRNSQNFLLDAAPHDWLFPRMAAVVHHGGAGTTAAGLRAGVPAVIVPHFGDQPFWARRVHALGASPPPIPRRRLTAERLAQALLEATRDSQMQAQAQELGDSIRAENGVERAIEILTGKP